jgi:hypothetical protein
MHTMRRAAPSIGIVLALAVASFAAAQDAQRPRDTLVIKSPPPTSATPPTTKPALQTPGQPVLRKPLRTANIAPRSRQTLPEPSLSPLLVAQSTVKGAVIPLKGLVGPSASTQAAQCRAQCAEARYTCTAQESGDCDTVWGECVVRCSGANYTETPDLASSTPYRSVP